MHIIYSNWLQEQCLDKRKEEVSWQFGIDGGHRSVTRRSSSSDSYKRH